MTRKEKKRRTEIVVLEHAERYLDELHTTMQFESLEMSLVLIQIRHDNDLSKHPTNKHIYERAYSRYLGIVEKSLLKVSEELRAETSDS